MIKQLIIGLACEGVTDTRFLSSIIKRTFEAVVLEHTTNIEILDVQNISVSNDKFVTYAHNAAVKGAESYGILVMCLHSDADSTSDKSTFENKINPAISHIENQEGEICKIITPIVPIRMTESWMLADEDCFKDEIGTDKSLVELGISQRPEQLSDPKSSIKAAIKIAFDDRPKRRSRPELSELYLPIGQKSDLSKLEDLLSYNKFKLSVKESLVALNYMQ